MLLFAQFVELAFTLVTALGFIKGLRLADRYALIPRLPNSIAHRCGSFLQGFTNGFNSVVPDTSGVLATVLLLPTNPDIAPLADSKRNLTPIDDPTRSACHGPLFSAFHCLGGVPEAVDIANVDPVDRLVDGPGPRSESPELGAAPAERPVAVDLATRSSESGAVSSPFGGSRCFSPSCAGGEALDPGATAGTIGTARILNFAYGPMELAFAKLLAEPKAHLQPMKSHFDAFIPNATNAPVLTVLACFALVKSRDILKLIASVVNEPRVTATQLLHALESAALQHDLESVQCLLVSLLIAALLGVGSLAHDIAFFSAAALIQISYVRSACGSARNSIYVYGTMLKAAVSAVGKSLSALPTRFTLDMLLLVGENIRTDTLPFTRKPSSSCEFNSEFSNREHAHSWSSGSAKDSDLSLAEDVQTEPLNGEHSSVDVEAALSGSPELVSGAYNVNDGELSATDSAIYGTLNSFDDKEPMKITSSKIIGLTDPSGIELTGKDNLTSVLYNNVVTCQTSNGTDKFRSSTEAITGTQSIDFNPVSFQCSDPSSELAGLVDPSAMSLSPYATQSDATSVPCSWLLLGHEFSGSMNTICVKDQKPRKLYSEAVKGVLAESHPADLRTANDPSVGVSGAKEPVVPELTLSDAESSSSPNLALNVHLESPVPTRGTGAPTQAGPSLDVRLSALTVASSGPTNRSIAVFASPSPLLVSPSPPPSVLLTAKSSSHLPTSDKASLSSRSPLSLITNTQLSPPSLSNNSIVAVSPSLRSGARRLSGRVSENSMMALLSVSGLSGFEAWRTIQTRKLESFEKWKVQRAPGPDGDSENGGIDSSVPLTEGPEDGVYGVGLAA